jgi:serine/threonine-protein kinase
MNAPALLFDGKYRFVRKIGEGGMGSVHEAVNARTGKKIAIKMMSPLIARDHSAVERFMREARAATSIEHPNVVQILDVGIDEQSVPYMVMELLQGESLAQLIEREAPLQPARLVQLLGPMLGALAVAHRQGIVHRDLKPDNIFLSRTAGTGITVPKLLDFGISKILDSDGRELSLTHTGTVLGTPFYMAPEQAAGKRTIDRRTDIYAMGVILYQALSGRLPFMGENYNALIVAILQETPAPLPEHVPPALQMVIAGAMAREMSQRISSVEELMGALGAAVGLASVADASSADSDLGFAAASVAALQRSGTTGPYGALPASGATPYPASAAGWDAMPSSGGGIAPPTGAAAPLAASQIRLSKSQAMVEPMPLPTRSPLVGIAVLVAIMLAIGAVGGAVYFMRSSPVGVAQPAPVTAVPVPLPPAIAPPVADPPATTVIAVVPTTTVEVPPASVADTRPAIAHAPVPHGVTPPEPPAHVAAPDPPPADSPRPHPAIVFTPVVTGTHASDPTPPPHEPPATAHGSRTGSLELSEF